MIIISVDKSKFVIEVRLFFTNLYEEKVVINLIRSWVFGIIPVRCLHFFTTVFPYFGVFFYFRKVLFGLSLFLPFYLPTILWVLPLTIIFTGVDHRWLSFNLISSSFVTGAVPFGYTHVGALISIELKQFIYHWELIWVNEYFEWVIWFSVNICLFGLRKWSLCVLMDPN